MGVDRVQERRSGDAIGSAALIASRIRWPGIATYDIVAGAAGVIGIVNPELRVIENVEGLRTKLKLARLGDPEMLRESHIEIYLMGVVQEITASIAEGQPSGCHKLRRVSQKRTKALEIVCRLRHPPHHVRI